MSGEQKKIEKDAGEGISSYLTEDERRRLLINLHRFLVWVGVQIPVKLEMDREIIKKKIEQYYLNDRDIPPEVHMNTGTIYLHDLIWRLINEKELTEKEKLEIEELISILEAEEKHEEELLKKANLTRSQAKQLYNETAGVMRALLDLKDLLGVKKPSEYGREAVNRKVEDAKRWSAFMEQIKK